MLTTILGWIGGTVVGKIVISVVLAGIVGVSYYGGYKRCSKDHLTNQTELIAAHLTELERRDIVNRELEKALIKQGEQTDAKVETIIEKIPTYITPDGCTINNAGVRHIRSEIKQLFPDAK